MKQPIQQFKEGALNLSQIQYQNGHDNHMRSSIFQLRHDQSHSTLPLLQAEPAFHFLAPAFILVVLNLVPLFTLPGPPQCRAGQTDTTLFAVAEILPIPVDLICQNPARIVPLPFAKILYRLPQLCGFVVCVEGMVFQTGPAIYNTDIPNST